MKTVETPQDRKARLLSANIEHYRELCERCVILEHSVCERRGLAPEGPDTELRAALDAREAQKRLIIRLANKRG